MNDELSPSDEQLRLATSRSLPGDTPLDAETASLRDAFMALGTAVESAAGPTNEAAIVARLNRSLTLARSASEGPIRRFSDTWPLLLTVSLAAATLVAIVRIASVSPNPSTVAAVTEIPRASGPIAKQLANIASTGSWNDSLDDEITLAATTLQQLSGTNQGFDGSLMNMNDRLEALSQELSSESL